MKKLIFITATILFYLIAPVVQAQDAPVVCGPNQILQNNTCVQAPTQPQNAAPQTNPYAQAAGSGSESAGNVTGATQTPTPTPSTPSTPTATPAASIPSNTACPNGGVQNANGSCNLGYTPLEPIPGVTGTNFTLPDGTQVPITDPRALPYLINAVFKILFTLGALLAVTMLVIGGIQYMTSEAIGNKKQGLDRAQNALKGMALLAGAWLILYTINPQLLQFNLNPCPAGTTGCTINAAPANNAVNPVSQTTLTSSQIQQAGIPLANSSALVVNDQNITSNSNQVVQYQLSSCSGGAAQAVSGSQLGYNSNQTVYVCQQTSNSQTTQSVINTNNASPTGGVAP